MAKPKAALGEVNCEQYDWSDSVIVTVVDSQFKSLQVQVLAILLSGNNHWQVVRTLVPLSPSTAISY